VCAGVHHNDAVTSPEEKFGLTSYSDAVIGDAMEEKNPASVGMLRAHDPASKEDPVRSANVESFAVAAGIGERGVGFADEVWGEFAADGVKKTGGD
jgi:hypothetical protein